MIKRFLGLCILLIVDCMVVGAQNSHENDEMLHLLQQSLNHNFDSLKQTDYPVYFMSYRVSESTEFHANANFGCIYENNSSKSVILSIEIRVGSPETDNLHYLSSQNNRHVRKIELPLDCNPNLINKILTQETYLAYKDAVVKLIENQIHTKIYTQDNDEYFSYLNCDADHYYESPIQDSQWDKDVWAQTLRRCTENVALSPIITEESADFIFRINRKYLVNSENRSVVENHTYTILTLRIEGQTSKKELEHVENQYFALFPEQLPDADVLQQEMRNMETRLHNILHASDYYSSDEPTQFEATSVPVFLSEKAASILAHHLFGHSAENTYNSLVTGKVVPEAFSVFCDPTITKYDGYFLSGSYHFDDEGVKSQRITLIDKGELKQLPTTRTQRFGSYYLNGHARGNRQMPAPRSSNVMVTTSKPQDNNQLKEILLEEARRQKKEFGLYVEDAEIRCDTSNEIITIYPTTCYKFFTNLLPDEEVRGIVISGSTKQWFDNLIAGGNSSGSVSITCHNLKDEIVTHSCSPALLFRQADIYPYPKETSKRIVYQIVAPLSNVKENISELFLQTAQEEWTTDIGEMTVEDINAPYYQEYLMTDARIFTVEASEGNLYYSNEKQIRKLTPKVLLGSNLSNNENIYDGSKAIPESYKMSIDNHKGAFVRDFRKATESEYLKAIKQWEVKKATTRQANRQHYMSRSYMDITQSFDEQYFNFPILNDLENIARETSATLDKDGFLCRSGVNIYVLMGNVLYWNSEKTDYIRPISVIGMQIYGVVKKSDGKDCWNSKTIFLPCTDSLFSTQAIQNEIDKFVFHLQNVKRAGEEANEYYVGPVLIEGDAVGQLLSSMLLEQSPNLLAFSNPLLDQQSNKQSFEGQLDNIITSKKISITANKSGDRFDKSSFVRHEKTDAEGVEREKTEIIRNGELIALMGNRNITKSTPYSNGFQQLAVHDEGCFGTRGTSRLDFEHNATISHKKLKQMLFKEAKSQGCQYAYIIRQVYDANMCNIMDRESSYIVPLLQCYRVDVRTGKEVPVIGANMPNPNFNLLQNILYVSDKQEAFPVMMQVSGATGTRDFPFAGVTTCIVAPDGLLLKSAVLHP